MAVVNPYLNFSGNTEEAFHFYRSVFGGEFVMVMRFKDAGMDQLPEADQSKIMHISLPIGTNTILMGTDALESAGHKVTPGDNFSLAIGTASKEEADTFFAALSAGGNPTSPMKDEFWGAYFGMVTDKFGIQWMVSYDPKHLPA